MSQCLTLLTQLSLDYYIRGVWALFDLPKETIEYSGKALNDLGFYDPCLASGFNYALINIQGTIIYVTSAQPTESIQLGYLHSKLLCC